MVNAAAGAFAIVADATAILGGKVPADVVARDLIVLRAGKDADGAGQVGAAIAHDAVAPDEDVVVLVILVGLGHVRRP